MPRKIIIDMYYATRKVPKEALSYEIFHLDYNQLIELAILSLNSGETPEYVLDDYSNDLGHALMKVPLVDSYYEEVLHQISWIADRINGLLHNVIPMYNHCAIVHWTGGDLLLKVE